MSNVYLQHSGNTIQTDHLFLPTTLRTIHITFLRMIISEQNTTHMTDSGHPDTHGGAHKPTL